MVLFILIVAVLNVVLGFAIARYLGRRYQEMMILAVESVVPSRASAAWGTPLPELTEAAVVTDEEAAVEEPLGQTDDDAEGATPEADARGSSGLEAGEQDPATALSTAAPSDREGPAASEGLADAAPDSDPPVSAEEASTQRFISEVEQYHQQLVRLDDALRECKVAPEAAGVRSCIDSLRQTNDGYRASRDELHQAFEDVYEQQETFQHVVEEIRQVVGRQDAQIDETDAMIRDVDCQTDPGDSCRQVAQEMSKLLQVNHDLRDTLDEATVVAARHDGRLGSVDQRKLRDPLTELSNRAGLEACLADWWRKDPHRVRQLDAAMIDLDEFGRVNDRHGQDVGDRILRATARILTGESRNHLIAARYSGQRFVLLFPDVDLRYATNLVERIRQTIELTRLKHRGEDIRVTVSCAVTEVGREDTPETLYARAEDTLREAKRYGRNRTFLHEGKYPDPVVPPNFSLEEKSVML